MTPMVVRALLPVLMFSVAAYGGAFTWRSVEGNAEKYLAQAGKTVVSADCETLKAKTAKEKQDASFEKISGGAKDNLKDRCLGAVLTKAGKDKKKKNEKLTSADYKCTGEKAHVELLPGGKVTIVSRGQYGVKEGKCSTVICSGGKCAPAKLTKGVKASDIAGVKPAGPADTNAKKLSEALKKEEQTDEEIKKLTSGADPISGAFSTEDEKALKKAEADKQKANELIKQWGETGAVPPIAASELRDHFRQTAEKICAAGMCWDKTPEEYATYIQEMAKHESKFNPEAAYKRAKGMTQVETNTANDNMETYRNVFGGTEKSDQYNPKDPKDSIQMGGIVLAAELERCNGDMHCALRAYNAGFGRKDIPVAHRYADAVIEGANRVFAGEPPSGRISGNTVGEVKGPLSEFYRRIAQPEYVNTPDVDPTVRPTRLAGTIQPTSLVLSPTPYSDNTFISELEYQKYDYPGVAPTPTPTPQPPTESDTEFDAYSGFTYPKYPKEPEVEPTRFAGNPDPRLGEDVLGSTGPTQPTQAECTTFACAAARKIGKPVAERDMMMPGPQISERGPTLDELLQRPKQPTVSFLSTTQSPTLIPPPTEHFGGTEPAPTPAVRPESSKFAYDYTPPALGRGLTSTEPTPVSPSRIAPPQEDYRKVGSTPAPAPKSPTSVYQGEYRELSPTPVRTPYQEDYRTEPKISELGVRSLTPRYPLTPTEPTPTPVPVTPQTKPPFWGLFSRPAPTPKPTPTPLPTEHFGGTEPAPTPAVRPESSKFAYDYTPPALGRGLTSTEPTPVSPSRIAPPQEDYRKVGSTPAPAPKSPTSVYQGEYRELSPTPVRTPYQEDYRTEPKIPPGRGLTPTTPTPTTPTPTTPTPTTPTPTVKPIEGPIPVPKPKPSEAPPRAPTPTTPTPPPAQTPPPSPQPGPQPQQQTGGPPAGMPSMPSMPSMPGGGSQGGGVGGQPQQQGTQQPIPQSQPCSVLNQFFGNCPQPMCTLSATPTTVELGKGVTLSWQTQNVFSAQITGVGQVSPTNTSMNVFPLNTTTYTMEVQSQTGQRASCQTIVNVTPRQTPDDTSTSQVMAELSCAPKTAEVGYNIGITFACRNAEKAEGAGFETGGELEGEATAEIAPPEVKSVKSVTYKLTCTDKGGKKATEQCSVDILRTSIVLVANPKEIASGDMANIGWATVGMKSCVVSSNQLTEWNAEQKNRPKTKGVAKTPALTSDTDFTLTCETKAGSMKTAKATVSIK